MKTLIFSILVCMMMSSCDVWLYDEPTYVRHYPVVVDRPHPRPMFRDGHRNMRPSPMRPSPMSPRPRR